MLSVLLLAAIVVGCTAPAATDPYVLTSNSLDAGWHRVQLELSLRADVEDRTVAIERGDIRLAFDAEAGTGSFSLSVAPAALGLGPDEVVSLGLPGDRLELDVLFDGEAVFARSPLAAHFLPMLLAQFGDVPAEDYSGWLRLGTKQEFEVLAALASMGSPQPDFVTPELEELAALGPAELQQLLADYGVALSFVGVEHREGVEASHLRFLFDTASVAQNQFLPGLDPRQLGEMAAAEVRLTTDAWLHPTTNRPVELSFEMTSSDPALPELSLSLYVGEPDASVTFAAPDSYVDVPVLTIIQQFMGSFVSGDFGP